jgi:outer membrane phospholipase A
VSAEEVRNSVWRNIPIVRATERLWVRLSVPAVAVVGLLTVAPRVWWRLLTSRKDEEHGEVEEVSA